MDIYASKMTIENKLDCTWLFVNSICCTGM